MLRNRSSFCCCGCCRYCDARWKLAKFHRHWRGSASVWETNCQLTHPAVVKQVTGRSVGRSRGRCVRQRERKHFPALASELRRPRATNGQPDGVLYRALGASSGRHWTNFRLRRPRLRGGACYIPTCPGRSVGEPLPRRDSAGEEARTPGTGSAAAAADAALAAAAWIGWVKYKTTAAAAPAALMELTD